MNSYVNQILVTREAASYSVISVKRRQYRDSVEGENKREED